MFISFTYLKNACKTRKHKRKVLSLKLKLVFCLSVCACTEIQCFSCVIDLELCTSEIRASSKTSISWSSQRFLDTNRKHIFSFGFFVMLCKWAVIRVRASNISEPLPGRLAQRSEAELRLWCAVDVCKCTGNAQTIQSLAFLSGTHAQTWYLKFQQAYQS